MIQTFVLGTQNVSSCLYQILAKGVSSINSGSVFFSVTSNLETSKFEGRNSLIAGNVNSSFNDIFSNLYSHTWIKTGKNKYNFFFYNLHSLTQVLSQAPHNPLNTTSQPLSIEYHVEIPVLPTSI